MHKEIKEISAEGKSLPRPVRYSGIALRASRLSMLHFCRKRKSSILNTPAPGRKCGICRWQRPMVPVCLGMMKRNRRKKKRLSAKNNTDLLSYGCPEKITRAFSPATYRVSVRESVFKKCRSQLRQGAVLGDWGSPQKAMQSGTHSALLASFV